MNTERLRHMIEVLRRVKAESRPFDLRAWACGTACCAIGYAALDPEFQAQGLKLRIGDDCPASIDEFDQVMSRHPWQIEPIFDGAEGWPAATAFFGLTEKQAGWLFADISYKSHQIGDPAAVIARIKHMIDGVPEEIA